MIEHINGGVHWTRSALGSTGDDTDDIDNERGQLRRPTIISRFYCLVMPEKVAPLGPTKTPVAIQFE
jgi:hypothetical protein